MVPLYFEFGLVLTKDNLTVDKFITLENWTHIFDELTTVITNGLDPTGSKRNKTFRLDHGRLNVEAKWIKISDASDVGNYILKILSLRSSNVGRYFLKINVRLGSYLESLQTELIQKVSIPEVKSKSKDSKEHGQSTSHDVPSSSKQKKFHHRKISDMLPTVSKEQSFLKTSSLLNDAFNDSDALEHEINEVEEYIPLPGPAPITPFSLDPAITYNPSDKSLLSADSSLSEYSPTFPKTENEISVPTHSTATYNPEKNVAQIEMNLVKSEYSPTSLIPLKLEGDTISYKPTAKRHKSPDFDKLKNLTDKPKKSSNKKKCLEWLGLTDESDDDQLKTVSSSSSTHTSKQIKDSSRKRAKISTKERSSKTKKKKLQDIHDSSTEIGEIAIR